MTCCPCFVTGLVRLRVFRNSKRSFIAQGYSVNLSPYELQTKHSGLLEVQTTCLQTELSGVINFVEVLMSELDQVSSSHGT